MNLDWFCFCSCILWITGQKHHLIPQQVEPKHLCLDGAHSVQSICLIFWHFSCLSTCSIMKGSQFSQHIFKTLLIKITIITPEEHAEQLNSNSQILNIWINGFSMGVPPSAISLKGTLSSYVFFFFFFPNLASCSKFLSACRNKARSPFSSAPFNLRTEERAASRKKARVCLFSSIYMFLNCDQICFTR